MCASDSFVVVAVCVAPDGSWSAEQYASTVEDGVELAMSPCYNGYAFGDTVSITGVVIGGGRLHLGGETRSGSGEWMYQVSLIPGFHDVIVSDDYLAPNDQGRVVLRRNQDLRESSAVAPINLAVEGVPMASASVQLEGMQPGDTVVTQTYLTRQTDSIELASTVYPIVHYLPASFVEPDEEQRVSASVFNPPHARGVQAIYYGQQALTLLPVWSSVQMTDSDVTWTSVPAENFAEISFSIFGDRNSRRVRASKRWVADHGTMGLFLENNLPGYSAEWNIPSPRQKVLQLTARTADSVSSTAVSETSNP